MQTHILAYNKKQAALEELEREDDGSDSAQVKI
jgi:hypothetical protein